MNFHLKGVLVLLLTLSEGALTPYYLTHSSFVAHAQYRIEYLTLVGDNIIAIVRLYKFDENSNHLRFMIIRQWLTFGGHPVDVG